MALVEYSEKFPEAFRRFERDVDTRNIRNFRQLRLAFGYWAGRKWRPTRRQLEALEVEARRLGLRGFPRKPRPRYRAGSWRLATFKVKGKLQSRYRDLKTGRFIKKPF